MGQRIKFDELLEAVEELPADEQADLIEVVRRRLAERGRQRVADEVRQARKDYADGKCTVTTVDELMRRIKS